MRPSKWLALERRDVDCEARLLRLRRVYVNGRVRDTGKTAASVPRVVPLRERVLDALEALPPRVGYPAALFSAQRRADQLGQLAPR